MPSVDRILALKLITDVGDMAKQMKGVSGRYKSMTADAKKWGKALGTGVIIDGIEGVTDALGDAWDGFRSGQKVAAQLGGTWKNLGLDGTKLQSTLDKVTASTLKLGTSDDEAVQAFTNNLQRTKDYNESLKRLQIAQDLVANGSAPNLSAAFKIVDKAAAGSKLTVDKFGLTSKTAGGRVAELGRQVKGAAAKAAALNPLGRLFNHLAEDAESFVGAIAGGDIEGALKSLRGAGKAINDALFGTQKKKTNIDGSFFYVNTPGLVDKFAEVGTKLGEGIKTAISTELGKYDLSKVFSFEGLAGMAQTAIQLVQTNSGVLTAIGIAAVALGALFSATMFVASVFVTAASAIFAAPAFLASGAVGVAVALTGKVLGIAMRGAMFVASAFANAAVAILSGPVWSATGKVGTMASSVGTTLGKLVGKGMALGIALGLAGIGSTIQHLISDEFAKHTGLDPKALWDNIPAGLRLPGFASGTDSAPGGLAWVGEHGKELVNLPGGSAVASHGDSMGMGGGGTVINVTVMAGPASDPASIGKTIDGLLQQYYRRSGRVTAR